MFLTRLLRFARLPAAERRLAWRAIGWLIVARAALRVLPFGRVHAFTAGGPREDAPPRGDWPRTVRRAVMRASHALPGASCLAQALVAERLLRESGHAARLSIGVADAGGRAGTGITLDAHAWVESGGMLVTGDAPLDRYHVLAMFGSE